jgi:hypothetical protein
MYEPKYSLNKKDHARFHALVVRHALEAGKRRYRKYPPLTLEENIELGRLERKRSQKLTAHPSIRAAIEANQRRDRLMHRRILRLLKKMEVQGLVKNVKP